MLLPTGWSFVESGTNANTTYTANNGGSNTGDTYSYGDVGGNERALGTLLSTNLTPTIGVNIQNNTGLVLNSLTIEYTGEQWRLGAEGRTDRLDFQYSLDATSLTSGAWTDVDALDFVTPNTLTVGAKDGNASGNRALLSVTITTVSLANGAQIWFRWSDANASGADDGLAVDDFRLTATGATAPPATSGPASFLAELNVATQLTGVNQYSVSDPDSGSLTANLAVTAGTLSLTAGGASVGGNGTSALIVSGTIAQVNAALATLSYTAPASGTAATLTANANDGTATGNTVTTTINLVPPSNGRLRIVSYNIASLAGNPRSGLETILQGIGLESVNGLVQQIDVLALQEVQSQSITTQAVVSLLNSLYGGNHYARGNMDGLSTGGNDDTQGVVYNSQKVQLLGEVAVGAPNVNGAPRQTLRYHFRPVGTGGSADFYLYNSHLKSGNTTTDEARRLVDAQAIRDDADALGQGINIIYAGDFNIYGSGDDSYQEFLSPGNGQAFDPLSATGNWSNNSVFVGLLTQAPAISPPGGLIGGGLDDRFDFQIFTSELTDGQGLEYLSNSYHAFGNNGSVSLNGQIDAAMNTALPGLANRATVLNLLTTVSDHLPVVADYSFPVANDSPVVSGPAGINAVYNATVELSGANLISIADPDNDNQTVTLGVTAGTLNVVAGGATVTGNGTPFLIIGGALADVNAALATLAYTAPGNGPSATLTALANDGVTASNLLSIHINLTAAPAGAVIPYTTAGTPYFQNFNGLPSVISAAAVLGGVPVALTAAPINAAASLAGWYTSVNTGTPRFGTDAGASTTGSTYSYGVAGVNPVMDRALGSVTSGSSAPRYGAVIANQTGQTLGGFTLTFTEEQWRKNTGVSENNNLVFEYKIGGMGLDDTGFISNNLGNLVPIIQDGASGALDGNSPANRAVKSVTVTGLNWASGANLVIRWQNPAPGVNAPGLAIDDLTFLATALNQVPVIVDPANASPDPVTGTTTSLNVLGADDGGESNLTYTWSTLGTPPAPVQFSVNGTNLAKQTTATFTQAGNYAFLVNVTDAGSLSASSMVIVSVVQTPTGMIITPDHASVAAGGQLAYSAAVSDQFGQPIFNPALVWSVTGAGNSIDSQGLLTAGAGLGQFTVQATSGTANDTTSVTVVTPSYTVLNTNDAGVGSLRAAILAANAGPAIPAWIAFEIPGGGVQTINLASPLPALIHPSMWLLNSGESVTVQTGGAAVPPLLGFSELTVAGGGSLTLNGPLAASGDLIVTAGGVTLTNGLTTSGDVTVFGAAQLVTRGLRARDLTLAGANAVVTGIAEGAAAGLFVIDGELSLANDSLLDLADNDLVVAYDPLGINPLAVITAALDNYYNGSTGVPVIGSSAVADSLGTRVIIPVDNANASFGDIGNPFYDLTLGDSSAGTGFNQVIVRFTYPGDYNLDGRVDGTDYGAVDSNLGMVTTGGAGGFFLGDGDFNGLIENGDYTPIDSFFGSGVGTPLGGDLEARSLELTFAAQESWRGADPDEQEALLWSLWMEESLNSRENSKKKAK
ncbi:MAG: hypothetical protein SFX18_20010 [Pirellulales bacterium]|nr:hypothetical protein [Pirellulales bacterium]